MSEMLDTEIVSIYTMISEYHAKYLADKGVTLPTLKDKQGKYTKDALVLVRLAKNYPDTDTISKKDLTVFMSTFYKDTVDVQQQRHLSMQKGWNIASGTRGDILPNGEKLASGSYKLVDLESVYSAFRLDI